MKLCLLNNERVKFDIEGYYGLLPKLSALVHTSLSHTDKSNESNCENVRRYLNTTLHEMNTMQSRLDKSTPPAKKAKTQAKTLKSEIQAKDWDLLLTIAQIPKDRNSEKELLEHHEIDFTVLIEGDLISCLRNLCGENILLIFKATKVPVYAGTVEETEISTGGMQIVPLSSNTFGCKKTVNFDFELYDHYWYSGFNIEGNVTITLIVPDNIGVPAINDDLKINKMILSQKVFCDCAIVSNNGVKSECHKSFLSAHSDVFHRMLSGNFQEAKDHTINMEDITERGVKALLEYLYFWDIREAVTDVSIAFELLKVSHKYNIKELEATMNRLFRTKPFDWFELDVTLELYVFVRELDDLDLKQKIISALRTNPDVLHASERYQELINNDPIAEEDLRC